MRNWQRELTIAGIAIVILLAAAWRLFNHIKDEKKYEQVDLYAQIAADPGLILSVNHPVHLTALLEPQTPLKPVFTSFIPDIYFSIIKSCSPLSSPLFTFHPEGVIFYAKTNSKDIRRIENKVLKPYFEDYPPTVQNNEGIHFNFFPDTSGHFFGYYHNEGIMVASYSRKLLEKAAYRSLRPKKNVPVIKDSILSVIDKKALINIIFPADSLNLYTQINDSTFWHIRDQWIGSDLFTNDGKICCYGQLPYQSFSDSVYYSMADTISMRLENLFPGLTITSEINNDGKEVYYMGCSSY